MATECFIACLIVSVLPAAASLTLPQVDAWGPNSFRVRWASPGFAIIESEFTPFVPQQQAEVQGGMKALRTINGNLCIDIDAATGLITATRVSDSAVLLRQTSLSFAPALVPGLPPSAEVRFAGHGEDEVFVGGGEQGLSNRVTLESPFARNYADTEYYGYNMGRQAFVPLFFSTRGYGFLTANPGYGTVDIEPAPKETILNASSIKVVDIWVTTTPGTPVTGAAPHPLLSLLEQYADAVGHAPLMPYFASGFIASKDRYHNQTQFLSVAHGYVDRGIPISLLTIDWFHWPALGDMQFKSECWPNPQSMIDELRGLGIETMVTHWPFMSAESVHRSDYETAGALAINVTSGKADVFWEYLQAGALITTLSESTRNLTERNWLAGYGRYGVKAMWLDETEPDRTGEADHALRIGKWSYEGTNCLELGPTWRQQWLRTMTDTLKNLWGAGNYFLLSRSAWLGTAKYGHAVWSGDTYSSWEAFGAQIPTALGAGLSGIGLWTSDLGGYSPTMQAFDPKLEELYVRWAQYASVSPLMRLHGHRPGGPPDDPVCMQTNGDNEPWTLFKGGEASPNYAAFVAAIRWREQRRPYVMEAQARWAAYGAPMVSPVWLLFPGDTTCAPSAQGDGPCADAFMFGNDFLAKPVTQYQQTSSWVWLPLLPVGQSWMNVFTNENLGPGDLNVTVATPISSFPLFQRTQGDFVS